MPTILRARLAERMPELWDYPSMGYLPAPEWVSVSHFDEDCRVLAHLNETLNNHPPVYRVAEEYLEPIRHETWAKMSAPSQANAQGMTHLFWCPDGGSVFAVELAAEE